MSIKFGDEEQEERRKKRAKAFKTVLALLPLLLLLLKKKRAGKKGKPPLPEPTEPRGEGEARKAEAERKATAEEEEQRKAEAERKATAEEAERKAEEEAKGLRPQLEEEEEKKALQTQAEEAARKATAEEEEATPAEAPQPVFPNSANVRAIEKGKNGEIYVLFSRGDIYRYSPDLEESIYLSLQKPYKARTSGENVFKKWRKGEPSIGASFWQLIAKPSKRVPGTYKKVSSGPRDLMKRKGSDLVTRAVSVITKRMRERSNVRP